MNKDYYKILGLNKNASMDDIKMAYKKLAMKYHPDRNPNDNFSEEKFKDVKEAYEFLTNKRKPDYVDSKNFNFTDFSQSESSLDDIFNMIFQKNTNRNNKLYFLLEIDLESAVYGSKINLKVPYQGLCDKCLGKGIKAGSDLKICNKCYGSGLYTIMQGIFNFKQKCHKCEGKGYVPTDICSNCFGSGKIKKNITTLLKINKLSDNNTIINLKISNEINYSNNIFVVIKIKPHLLYIRRDLKKNDLHIDFFIDFIKATLGGYIRILTLYGFILYKINKCAQNFKIYKINNFGLFFNKNNGDLYVNIFIDILSDVNFYQ